MDVVQIVMTISLAALVIVALALLVLWHDARSRKRAWRSATAQAHRAVYGCNPGEEGKWTI